MKDENEVVAHVEQYREIAKGNKGVDVGALAMFELQAAQAEERVNAKKRRWAYLLSAGLPPIGLVFAAYYAFSGKSDGKRTAWICVILTVVTVAISWLLVRQIMSSVDATRLDQLKSIDLEDYRSLLQ